LPSGEIVAVYDDVSEHKRAEEALRRHDAILKAAAFSAERFLTVPDWEQSIQEVLEQVGQAAGVERVYIFENERANDGTLLTSQRFEWAGPGVPSQMDDPRFIDIAWQASGFGRWEETLSRGKPIVGHVRDFPPSEQAVLSSQGILSLLDVPIFAGQHWWGFIGFDECRAEREWTDQEIEAVTVAANTLGAAIQRQQAEQALRESEDKYRQLFEIESDAIFLIDNESGNILEANPAAERLYGYSRNELLQMKHTDLSAEPERTRLAVKTRQERIPVRYHRKKDGTPVTVEISGGYLVWHGREAHVAAIRDITERQRAEAALRESEEKFRSIVEQSHDGVTLTDQNGVLVEWNRAAETITGLTRDAVSGRYAWDVQFSLLPEEKRTPALYEHMKLVGMNLLKKEDRLSTPGRPSEHEIRSRDGTRKVLQSVAFQIKEEAGFMVCGILRDITEQKRAQDQRLKLSVEQEKVKLLSSFVRDVSHEFRMPLSVVYTGLEVLERATALDDASVQRVGIIKSQALYIADLVDAMLLMARLDSDPQFAFSPVDLSVLARDVGIEMGTLLQKKAQTLTLDLADSLPVVQADPSKLRHALVNLCENAVQFTPDMGSITLRTYTRGEYAVIEVADTGIGLDDHDLPYIFERFYRADQARTERHAGLGLSIAQKIVEAHQGRIEVESAPGQGSTFRIVLPVVVG
jgi:PAS domain S-box-containing protein